MTGDYPPAKPGIEPRLSVDLAAGYLHQGSPGVDRLVVLNAQAGLDYCATLLSTKIDLGVRTARADGVLDFNNIHLPADFEYEAVHHLDVYRAGGLVGAFDFCVHADGTLAPASAHCKVATGGTTGGGTTGGNGVVPAVKGESGNGNGSLAHTGLARLADLLKAAGVALSAGVLFMYLRRRRAASVAQI